MASTNKTTNLGLNNWIESDCPKRTDFVSDNLIIDNLVGNHIKDSSLHLSAEEKDRATQPFTAFTYYGTGETTTTVKFSFSPQLVIVCKKNSPFTVAGIDYSIVNAAVVSNIGTSGGVTISDKTVTAKQSVQAENGVFYNLNKNGSEYLIVAFR